MPSPSAIIFGRRPKNFPTIPRTKEEVKKLTSAQLRWFRQYITAQADEFPENKMVQARLALLAKSRAKK